MRITQIVYKKSLKLYGLDLKKEKFLNKQKLDELETRDLSDNQLHDKNYTEIVIQDVCFTLLVTKTWP